ncbi:hypothetical protein [Hymenobacter sp. 102]|uniref:hypothetical protein n=1 Tax=Hymenobacter sp. 102 TaxID=3403152 RepID=UPI003CF525D3
MPKNIVSEALSRTLVVHQPSMGLIVYPDQARQYTATRFRNLLLATARRRT